jgi:hypothetical protein
MLIDADTLEPSSFALMENVYLKALNMFQPRILLRL